MRLPKLGRINGKPVYRIPVRIIVTNPHGDIHALTNPVVAEFTVLSHSAKDAAHWVRENTTGWQPYCEIIATGPQGGQFKLYTSFETHLYHTMMTRSVYQKQLSLEQLCES